MNELTIMSQVFQSYYYYYYYESSKKKNLLHVIIKLVSIWSIVMFIKKRSKNVGHVCVR